MSLQVEPRWATPRTLSRPTRGPLLCDVSRLLGFEPFGWQSDVADVALEYDPVTKAPAYRLVGVGVARQNGKTTMVVARIAMQLIVPGSTVAYTAQDRQLARFKWTEHVEMLMDSPFRHRVRDVVNANGREVLIMDNGSRYLIVTPGEKAGRSLTLDLAVIDEAFAQEDMALVGAIQPTMIARPRAQMWMLSNAGTSRSALWRHYTDVGRAMTDATSGRMCWIEYAADDKLAVDDPLAWAQGNPTLGIEHGVSADALADAAATMDEATFRREHLNQWTNAAVVSGIDPVAWAGCSDPSAEIGERIVLGFDVTPERDRAALVAAGPVNDRIALEVIDVADSLDFMVSRTIDVARRWNAPVAIDRRSAAGSAIPALEHAGIEVIALSLPDLVAACGDFHDAVVHRKLSHRGDYRLTDSVALASRRRVGDAWAWQRRGKGNLAPLMAATVARWGIVAEPEPLIPAIS